MPEERASESVEIIDEVEPGDLEKLTGLLDEEGNLPGVEEDAEPQAQKTATETPAPTEPDSPEQTAEVEYDGKKYAVPAELKDAFLRQSDYTRKTTEVAQMRAAAEQERQAVAKLAQEAQQYVGHYAAIQQIDQQLQQLQKVDWNHLAQADPLQNLQLRQTWTELTNARQGMLQQLDQARQKAQVEQVQSVQQQLAKGHEVLAKDIQNWGPELQTALMSTAASYGYRPEELASVTDPRAIKLLHKAYLYDKSQQQKTVAEKQVRQAPPKVVRPQVSQEPGIPRNDALSRLRRSGKDDDAVAALKNLGLD